MEFLRGKLCYLKHLGESPDKWKIAFYTIIMKKAKEQN